MVRRQLGQLIMAARERVDVVGREGSDRMDLTCRREGGVPLEQPVRQAQGHHKAESTKGRPHALEDPLIHRGLCHRRRAGESLPRDSFEGVIEGIESVRCPVLVRCWSCVTWDRVAGVFRERVYDSPWEGFQHGQLALKELDGTAPQAVQRTKSWSVTTDQAQALPRTVQ